MKNKSINHLSHITQVVLNILFKVSSIAKRIATVVSQEIVGFLQRRISLNPFFLPERPKALGLPGGEETCSC